MTRTPGMRAGWAGSGMAVNHCSAPPCRRRSTMRDPRRRQRLDGRANRRATAARPVERVVGPRPWRCTYCIEFSPKTLPSVSLHSATQPNWPIENLGRMTVPPAATTRACSTAQSATLK